MENYSSIVVLRAPKKAIDTTTLFDANHAPTNSSPVDQFLENCLALNAHWTTLKPHEEVAPELSRLFLLGYVSAVESYMRSLIRKLVNCDVYTKHHCQSFQLSYGAVLHHSAEALPDALLEETIFSIQNSIPQALKKFVGVDGLSSGTTKLLEEFDLICQLRHCCTHRFGMLGAKNAAQLGLGAHSKYLDKPIVLKKEAVASVADLTFTLVKSVNNDVFGFVLKRTATGKNPATGSVGIGWTWKKARDAARFKLYYDVFKSVNDATPSPSSGELYELFKNAHSKVGKVKVKLAPP